MMQSGFTKKLIEWHSNQNKRIMPWKGEKDPYKIWISEIILQQTRVKQGLLYYNNFIAKFPNIKTLAAAGDEDVFKIWEGLGYYSRCRNILYTARFVANHLNGEFPNTHEKIIALKGVGPYTAAAISSFAYGLPHAVVDGNVFRVLARFFGEALPIDSTRGKQHFKKLADQLLYAEDSASYNQAIMDFGATVCKPQNPLCDECVLRAECVAYHHGSVNELPIKEKQIRQRSRWFTYFIFKIDGDVLVHKRSGKDIWQGLYEFYLAETNKPQKWSEKQVVKWLNETMQIARCKITSISATYSQQLTHQRLEGKFIVIEVAEPPELLKDFFPANSKNFHLLSFPKFINQYLAEFPLF